MPKAEYKMETTPVAPEAMYPRCRPVVIWSARRGEPSEPNL
jgi:hypothetical protein